MAVVVRPQDVAKFIEEANKENIDAVVVAKVTDKAHLVMIWKGQTIVDIERSFLDTNGVRVEVDAKVVDSKSDLPESRLTSAETLEKDLLAVLGDLNHASQKGLQTIFDASVGRSTVNHPLGGRYQVTPTEASVQKLPVQDGVMHTASVMTQGYHPYLAEWSPYHGAAYAVIEATARLVATGARWSKARFSYQEYFQRMDKKAERFGQPVAALLGSLEAQLQLGLPSIGGKDSMSGSFEELTVPPTLVAFGVITADSRRVPSPEFKAVGETIYYLPGQKLGQEIDFDLIKSNFETFEAIQKNHKVTSASAVKYGGLIEALAYERQLVNLLDQHNIDLICLAGYMKIVGETLLAAYEGKIINIHPAYLPEFPGAHGIEDAWKAGVKESGVTIHWVDSGVDTGKVIKQVRVPRLETDTRESFGARIHESEYVLYPEVLDSLGVERSRDIC